MTWMFATKKTYTMSIIQNKYGFNPLTWVVLCMVSVSIGGLSCKSSSESDPAVKPAESESQTSAGLNNDVKVSPCIMDVFAKRTILTGVIKARESASISSLVGGMINKLQMADGQHIRKNDILLSLDDTEDVYALEQAKIRHSDATIKKNDLLMQYGGAPDDHASVNAQQLKVIFSNTGYLKTIQDIKELEYRIGRKKIKAPFDGIVADMKVKPYEIISAGQQLCTLINPATYEVSFMVMENYALKMRKGQTITVHPLHAPNVRMTAGINTINPKVNDQGLVEVRAKLNGNASHLFENMNMQVFLEEKTKPYILVPKSALVRRSERTVVFTYEEATMTAKWNYVTIVDENDTQYAISDGLKPGQLIIYDGNLNLDHGAKVRILKQ